MCVLRASPSRKASSRRQRQLAMRERTNVADVAPGPSCDPQSQVPAESSLRWRRVCPAAPSPSLMVLLLGLAAGA